MLTPKKSSSLSTVPGDGQSGMRHYLSVAEFEEAINLELNRAINQGSPLSLLMLIVNCNENAKASESIDLNVILTRFAKVINRLVRSNDKTYSCREDCLAVILQTTDYRQAMMVVNRIIRELEMRLTKEHYSESCTSFDIVIGISNTSNNIDNTHALVEAARQNKIYQFCNCNFVD